MDTHVELAENETLLSDPPYNCEGARVVIECRSGKDNVTPLHNPDLGEDTMNDTQD